MNNKRFPAPALVPAADMADAARSNAEGAAVTHGLMMLQPIFGGLLSVYSMRTEDGPCGRSPLHRPRPRRIERTERRFDSSLCPLSAEMVLHVRQTPTHFRQAPFKVGFDIDALCDGERQSQIVPIEGQRILEGLDIAPRLFDSVHFYLP
jgi:hypothetical protein